ncbi:DegV family protein [Anaerobacillus isosaccharinicus]|uniref:DegV family protein n=1 Tax=Anaerobacillus isosaccharinicus TaxID=1532552 RepID=A0A1S2MBD8_9BACI|nr:DegV family protein [Anaerobacillus isosaccharinicus]MBA5584529.1 DegV family protein [Anaerobacillus isosaccharinicus]QOY37088.1 DegV family protein [Anaerobacillus isosaccharinicus]
MSKIAIVTDSTAYLPKQLRDELGITMVPLNVIFGNETYKEETEVTTSDFYEMMKKETELPKTSQPAIGLFATEFERLAKDYDQVISIHLSSGISGTYQSAVAAGSMVEGIEVIPFDTEVSCMPQGFYVLEAAKLANEGKTSDEIISRLTEMKGKMRAYFMADDLSHLHRGGRLNGAQLIVGSLLQIKPVLHFEEGKIVPFEKVRTAKKALNRIYGLLDEDASTGEPIQVVVIHGNCEEEAKKISEQLSSQYPHANIMISYFGPVIGTHLGEGSIGIGWYKG